MIENSIYILKPDDWHVHLREGEVLNAVLPYTSKHFGKALVMPNLKDPVCSFKKAVEYEAKIVSAICKEQANKFKPLLACYLTENICHEDVIKAFDNDKFYAAKLYPCNATTNSSFGINLENLVNDNTNTNKNLFEVFNYLQNAGKPLLIHGEVTDENVDIFDREAKFIELYIDKIRDKFPKLKIVLEHISTIESINYIKKRAEIEEKQYKKILTAATITPHHVFLDRRAIFKNGISPDKFCLPILKSKEHKEALLKAMLSAKPYFFLGTDSAPHVSAKKYCKFSSAGIFNAPVAISVITTLFDKEFDLINNKDAQTRLENFCSKNGADFYGLKYNESKIKLVKKTPCIPSVIQCEQDHIAVFLGDELRKCKETLTWSVADC